MDNTNATDTSIATPAKSPKARKEKAPPKLYPFATKAQVKEKLAYYDYACAAMVVLLDRQTAFEVATRSTRSKNARGFMSSDAVHGTRIAQLLKAGRELDALDQERVFRISGKYSKQIAEHERTMAVGEDPSLADAAAPFFGM